MTVVFFHLRQKLLSSLSQKGDVMGWKIRKKLSSFSGFCFQNLKYLIAEKNVSLERKCTAQEPGRENPGAWLQGIRQKPQGQKISLQKKRDSYGLTGWGMGRGNREVYRFWAGAPCALIVGARSQGRVSTTELGQTGPHSPCRWSI